MNKEQSLVKRLSAKKLKGFDEDVRATEKTASSFEDHDEGQYKAGYEAGARSERVRLAHTCPKHGVVECAGCGTCMHELVAEHLVYESAISTKFEEIADYLGLVGIERYNFLDKPHRWIAEKVALLKEWQEYSQTRFK